MIEYIKEFNDVGSKLQGRDLINYYLGREYRKMMKDSNVTWIKGLSNWKNMITLTFKDTVPVDTAEKKFKSLLKVMNIDIFGKHYNRYYKHNYFGYVKAMEYQKREILHFHIIADQPVNFELIHKYWKCIAGFAWTEIIEQEEQVIEYIAKYLIKGGELDVFKTNNKRSPIIYPRWWNTSKRLE